MDIGQKIKRLRIQLGMSQEELGVKIGVKKAAIHKYENGLVDDIKRSKIDALAKALETTPSHLMGWDNDTDEENDLNLLKFPNISPLETRKFPLLGKIACGKPIFADEDHETYVEADSSIRADFCLRTDGDSMINARIQDGDIVFIRKQEMVDDGEIAAVVIDGEATLKRVYYNRKANKLVLNAENPRYRPLVYVGQELEQIRILGKVVAFMSYISR